MKETQDRSLGTWVTVDASATLDPDVPNVQAIIPALEENDVTITLPRPELCKDDHLINIECVEAANHDGGHILVEDPGFPGILRATHTATGHYSSYRNLRGRRWKLEDSTDIA